MKNEELEWKVYGTRTKRATHWMPLPDPPRDEQGRTERRNT